MKYIKVFESYNESIEEQYSSHTITRNEYYDLLLGRVPFDKKFSNYLFNMKVIYGTKVQTGYNDTIEVVDDYDQIENSDNKIIINQIDDNYFIVKDIPRRDRTDYYKCDDLGGLLLVLSKLYRVYKSDIPKDINRI